MSSGSNIDFSAVHASLAQAVERELLAGVSSAVLRGRDLLDEYCVGWADKEQRIPLRTDHIFRAFSNTKLVTSCAVLLLMEEGRFALDEPIDGFIPQLAHRRVLRPGATRLDDTEPARSPITIRHLLCHSSGLSYGLLDPGTMVFKAYIERKMLDPQATLAQMMDRLADLPLVFHPGTGWEYSVATDVLSRLVEVVSGQPFDVFIRERIFEPLGMRDTGFVVPQSQQSRLTAYYAGADIMDPLKPGLKRVDHLPWPGAYLRPAARLSGGGGLVTTLPDMLALLRSLLPGGPTLLRPQTLALMMENQLAPGVRMGFPGLPRHEGKGFGLGGSVTLAASPDEPAACVGEFQWGGMAGTHWWISPQTNLAGILMTQRFMGFWHPYSLAFKRAVYAAAGAD
jgi:CubicO group peptidase (beta-lactamase class C family)